MEEEQILDAIEAKDRFFEKVRQAYRDLKDEISEEQVDYVFDDIHHVVNLYNPYIAS